MPQVVYAEQWGLEPCALPVIVNIAAAHCDTLDFSPLDESSSLIFYNVSKHPRGGRQPKARVLQAGTPLGLMAYLYSRCSPGGGRWDPCAPQAPGDQGGQAQGGVEEVGVSLRSRGGAARFYVEFPSEICLSVSAPTGLLGQAPD